MVAPIPCSLGAKTLRFHVETVQLSNNDAIPPYYAISYTWGQNISCSKIYLNDHVLVIPRGAEEALRGVLKSIRAAKLKTLPIWIDAICVDQNDTEGEKAHQVSIMGDIYSKAECVLIWLVSGRDQDIFLALTIAVLGLGLTMVQLAGPCALARYLKTNAEVGQTTAVIWNVTILCLDMSARPYHI